MSNDVVNVLRAARALIAPPKCWTQGAFARDAEGCWVGSSNERAVCWCASGAIRKIAPTARLWADGVDALHAANTSGFYRIITLNDARTTTHADILALFDRAIAAAERLSGSRTVRVVEIGEGPL